MSKKLTYEFIKNSFEKENYTLLSKDYKNSKQKLDYICPNGHTHSIKWNDWQQGKGCRFCVNINYKNRSRITSNADDINLNTISNSFSMEGYILLDTKYINSKQKLNYICPNGHRHSISWDNWRQGVRCKYCYYKNKKLSNSIITIAIVKKSFEDEGYTLLSKEYKNNSTKLDYICPNGHTHNITWGHWNTSKSRCPYCSNNVKYSYEKVKLVLDSLGYTLLSSTYINSKTKLKYICDKGHLNESSFYCINIGHRCPTCAHNKKFTINHVRSEFKKEGYTLLSKKYINNKQKLKCVCSRGHTVYIRFDGWVLGRRCPVCKGINLSANRTGSGHPNWQGGISFEPYCEVWKDKEYKQDIRDRDGNKCLNPYCYGIDSVLSIHHIDYDKKNCKPSNLITVCRSCNSRANKDRGWHKAWYQAILNKRYGYNYQLK